MDNLELQEPQVSWVSKVLRVRTEPQGVQVREALQGAQDLMVPLELLEPQETPDLPEILDNLETLVNLDQQEL